MHSHSHSSDHNHCKTTQNKKKLSIILLLTTVYMIAEFIGGYLTNSLTLIADAGHMLSDVGALALSFFALWLYLKPASPEKTFGYYRTEILAAFINGLALIFISFIIIYEAYNRLITPAIVEAPLMIGIAIGGLIINIIGVLLLHSSSKENLNIHGAFLHIVGDLLGSIGAIVAGILILKWKFYIADPIISIIISLLILFSAVRLINEAVNVLLEASPSHINVESVREALLNITEVNEVHDLHIWSISSSNIAMSAHVVTESKEYNKILCQAQDIIEAKFKIKHITIQIEEPDFHDGNCSF